MTRLVCGTAFLLLFLVGAQPVHAQRRTLEELHLGDSTVVHVLRLRDGSQLVGRVERVTRDSVRIAIRSGPISVARGEVLEVREVPQSQVKNGDVRFPNPQSTRLLFSPTAFPMEKGSGYFSDIYLFFVSAQYAFTDRFSLGAGMSVFPLDNFADNLFYITPKYTIVDAPQVKLSLGGFLGTAGLASDDLFVDGNSVGIFYGVGSTGTRDSNVSLGLGWGYVGGEIADQPVVMLGAQGRVSKRVSLITENWIISTNHQTDGVFSYGVRFLDPRISVDLAFLNPVKEEKKFPGFPFVGFAIHF
ncbi:MAG: hypothetical protein ABI877_13340 [Gemmatimonadaceae bacterium]